MSSFLIPCSLLIVGAVFTAGHAAFKHATGDVGLQRILRVAVYLGLTAVLASSDHVVWTALWLGVLPSLGLASHVWFCRKHCVC